MRGANKIWPGFENWQSDEYFRSVAPQKPYIVSAFLIYPFESFFLVNMQSLMTSAKICCSTRFDTETRFKQKFLIVYVRT